MEPKTAKQILVNFVINNGSYDKPVSIKRIEGHLRQHGFPFDSRTIRELISQIVCESKPGDPVICTTTRGVYEPETNEEFRHGINFLKSMMKRLHKRSQALENRYNEMFDDSPSLFED